jgi:hypothetical protein
MARIPLYQRGRQVAETVVDAADGAWLSRWTWRLDSEGYASRNESSPTGSRKIRMHREILGLAYRDGVKTDHRNRNKLDNRRRNLRICTQASNVQNLTPRTSHRGKPTTSRFRGVAWHPGAQKWMAYGAVGGKQHYLGLFLNEQAAAKAAADWRAANQPYSTD